MSTWAIVTTALSACAAVAGIVFGLTTYARNRKKDSAEDGKQSGVILTELGYIKAGVDDVKRKQEDQDKNYKEILRDLTAVQESAKQAHHRIDGLEGRINDK